MTFPIIGGFGTAGSSAPAIANSLRFRASASAYLSRTSVTPTSAYKGTISLWCKRAGLGSQKCLVGTGTSNGFGIMYGARQSDELNIYHANGSAGELATSALYRDPAAWYHIVVAFDTTQATAANRVRLYINNVEQTAWYSSYNVYPSLNDALDWNANGVVQYIGAYNTAHSYPNDALYAHCCWVDGQALTPSSFAAADTNGEWKPLSTATIKTNVGNFGNNGFLLDFANTTSTTTLGYDVSGKGNNWTCNNISLTAGPTYDALIDSPCNGTSGTQPVGNYATLNPLDKNSGITLSAANLDASMPTTTQNLYGSFGVSSGKWYWETTINTMTGRLVIGVANAGDPNWNLDPASSSALWGYYSVNGGKMNGGSVGYGNSYTANDVIQVALDMDTGKIWWGKNNTWQASGDPAAGTNAAFTNLSGTCRAMYEQQMTGAVTFSVNFGQRPFAYTPPTGFKALCTTNLTSDTIITSGTFTGNVNADGPSNWLNGVPTAMTINGNAVTWGTHADKTAYGFKVRTASASYNASGSNTFSVSTTGNSFRKSNAQGNP